MATLKVHLASEWSHEKAIQKHKQTPWTKWLKFADSQAPYKTAWFLVSLIAQGVLFLPIPAVLMYYYQAPIAVLAVTMILFFGNVISGMGGSGIRVVLTALALSVIIHLLMLAIFIF
ncbi:hypothetical protein [Mucilaginibacter ginkgonis]|uniref:Uncharacterized protein n=1 Tax=Mucilaginibacter ginkgonis TaxID=2682091 RepID=A0A6I4HU76_9SPHI|nr:hypothetical protein [Mucilaginibacter ginkgonis]QQL50251.1 hypothetical protein GO620_002010 [Mucilaginibacter ginkgonis]